MRILIVEDEASLREQLVTELKQQQFVADAADNGEEGHYLACEWPYDAAIIDLGLPGMSGLELIRKIRGQNIQFPILILTAQSDWQNKVTGLEAGADDYLTKPFHMEELVARINALIRRASGHSAPVLQFGPLAFDTNTKQARVGEQALDLTAYEYSTLEYLILHAGKVVSKTELTEHIYDQDFDLDSNTIEVFINRLRKKIDPNGVIKPIITERGRGYRFVLTQTD